MPSDHRTLALPCSEDSVDDFLSQPNAGAVEAIGSAEGDIIVLGAGGKMGLHLCGMLRNAKSSLGREFKIYAASRFQSLHDSSEYDSLGIEVLKGDFRDEKFVESLPHCETVFYLAGTKFGSSEDPSQLQEINVDVAARLARRYRHSRIVALSTGCVYSYVAPDSGGSKEESEMNPIGEYAKSSVRREEEFQNVSNEYGTPVALIRLNYSVEFRYGVLLDIGLKVFHGEPIDISTSHVNVIWQSDALNHVIQALTIADSPPAPINVTGAGVLGVRELAEGFGRRFQRDPIFAGEAASSMWLSDPARSHRLFGTPAVGIEQMMDWVAAWISRQGSVYGKPTRFEVRDGRF